MSPHTPNDKPLKPRTGLRRLGLLGSLILCGAGLVPSGLWWWAGTAGSLASTLNLAAQLMPAGQRLSTDQVEGSLRHGGQVGQWHWQEGALQVHGEHTALTLDWPRLWQGDLPLTRLHVAHLRIDDQNPASEPKPLSTWHWPLRIDLPWQIDRLEWVGPPAFEALGLQGHYRYDGSEHRLETQPFEVAQGRYSVQARLQAASPMALHASLQGQVHSTGPAGSSPLTLDAQATAEGTLAGLPAALNLQALLQPSTAKSSRRTMQMKLQAQIHPWQAQAIAQAHADWQQLDLAALWPGAPQTSLTGQASVTPEGSGWNILGQLHNQNPGPWDRHALPLSELTAQLHRPGQGLWQIKQLQAKVASGLVKGDGLQTAAGWTGQVNIAGVQPAQLHTAMAVGALNGQIKAQAVDARTVAIQADLQGESALGKNTPGLRWDKLHLQGQWQAALWNIEALEIQAADARVQAQFSFAPQQPSAQGKIEWQLPGMKAQAHGLLAPRQGQGHLEVAMSDAALSMAWLKRWPGWAERLQGWQASGPAQLDAQWQGGYRQADAPIQMRMTLPRLSTPAKGPNAWQLQHSQIAVQGSLQALQASIEARWLSGTQTVQMQSQASASSTALLGGPWQGKIQSASVQVSSPERSASWKALLQDAVAWQWTPSAIHDVAHWQAGRIVVEGPSPGQAKLRWDAGQWQSSTLAAKGAVAARHTVTTALNAQIDDLPLSWLPLGLGSEIQSDVVLKGQVRLEQAEALHVRAGLERSRGDLRISAENAPGQRINSGLRDARLGVVIDNEDVQVQLNWDSEQMGQLQAQAQTRLSHDIQGWHWPEQAPVSGQLKAQLPRVGAWSLLAPPGWRVQGTLDTQLALTGTRQDPQWQGHVQANNLAVRSAVQGIEFSQGQLRARVHGQQIDLDQLSLRGAGAQGGELQTQGQLIWLPPAAGMATTSPLGQVDMVLNLQAKALRVSNRADRRLAISGQVKAQMHQGQLQLRGHIEADQGLFILPEDSTPTLGQDVVVTHKQSTKTNVTTDTPPQGPSIIGTPDVQVTLDLGPDFQVQGHGLTTRLTGQLNLLSNASTKGIPRLNGEVSTQGGRYKAYGQNLNIETGLLRFNGPYDNPLLDILAIRPNLSQRVGVQISGSAMNPKVRLYSDPELPDADKLAWLVLGRSGANGGAESAVLQQAALALFSSNGKTMSGEMAGALGLDEISLASGSRSDATATGAAVTLGKRLSKDFYLVYETSLKGTFGSFYVFYDLSRRLTLRAQTGQDNALDLIYTVRKD
jgi:translocation and assembly module TamB